MTNKKVSQMNLLASADPTDVLPIVDVSESTANANKRITSADLLAPVTSALAGKQDALSSFNNALFYQVSANNIQGIPDWAVNQYGGLTQTPTGVADNGGYKSINTWVTSIDHGVASPNETYALHQYQINLDSTNTGEPLGTNGSAILIHNNQINHENEADLGSLAFINNNFSIGQVGKIRFSVRGLAYSLGFGTFEENVDLVGPLQGYGFQPNLQNGVTTDINNTYVNAFYDSLNAPDVEMGWYSSFSASPNIGKIKDNRNYQGVNLNPSIAALGDNASVLGVGVYGTIGDFGVDGYIQGLAISPNVGTVKWSTYIDVNPTQVGGDDAVGISVNMSNVTATQKLAGRFTGDVQINGDLNFTGALSIGSLSAFSFQQMVEAPLGQPTSVHSLTSGFLNANGIILNAADSIGVNTAAIFQLEENSVATSGIFGLGACALALPAVIQMETTASIEHIRGAVFALNLDMASTGGTIDNLIGCRAVAVPNGVTTVGKYIAYEADLPFGAPTVDDNFGLFVSAEIYNWMRGSLCVGGTTEKTAPNVAIEINSNTKSFLNARMSTVERDAMTPINGMQIYNTNNNKFQGYANGAWVDLH